MEGDLNTNYKPIKSLFKLNPYRQTSNFSCGASCLSMILNSKNPKEFPLNRETELFIHSVIKYENAEFENGAKMIRFLREKGFKSKYCYYINWETINKPLVGISEEDWLSYLKEFFEILNSEKEKGIEIVFLSNNTDDALSLIIEELKRDNLIICEIQLKSFLTHAIIISGYLPKDKIFLAMDPLTKNVHRRVHYNELEKLMKITYGSENIYGWNFLSVYV